MLLSGGLALWRYLFNRKLALSLITSSILAAKILKIYSISEFRSSYEVVVGFVSFFAQDIILILVLHRFVGHQKPFRQRSDQVTTILTVCLALIVSNMAAAGLAFFLVTGSEIHWQNIGVVTNPSGLRMLLAAGQWTFASAFLALLILGCATQSIWPKLFGSVTDICLSCMASLIAWRYKSPGAFCGHESLPTSEDFSSAMDRRSCSGKRWLLTAVRRFYRITISVLVALQVPMALVPIVDPQSMSLAWTLPLVPLADHLRSLTRENAHMAWEDGLFLSDASPLSQDSTALGMPPRFPWLTSDTQIPGFEDWYSPGKTHYVAALDPLKISNMDNRLLESLRPSMKNIDIRHILLVILESTRSDVFPAQGKGIISQKLTDSISDTTAATGIAEEILALTPIANFLTGDKNNIFDKSETIPGYIRAKNAFTTSTYTLKSLVGTLCGISPLAVDFNSEVSHHIYQPCLSHILQALNFVGQSHQKTTKGFASFPWKSLFMQSVTGDFDRQSELMSSIGYNNGTFTSSEYLRSKNAKFGPTQIPDINYFGMPEVVLDEYIKDAFATAKINEERLFLTHLTSTGHHPFEIPPLQKRTQPPEWRPHEKRDTVSLTKYVDAMSYVDWWVGRILGVLDELEVTNDTLLVLVGDHGLSLPEQDSVTPHGNANIGNFRVPLIFSHPQLPRVDLEDAVISSQILPTILDLLSQTDSLSAGAKDAAHDLLQNFEGQSMLRPLNHSSSHVQGNWQFTVTNPGGTSIAVRDGRFPYWRLIMPLSDDTAWRFTDLRNDPYEASPFHSHDLGKLLQPVKEGNDFDTDRVRWVKEAVVISRWWVKENRRRWRYS